MLISYLYKNIDAHKKYKPFIANILNKIHNTIFCENINEYYYTSYSVNKGDKIVLCIRSRKNNTIHNINILMYVAIHELAHIGCPEKNHTPLFHDIFKFMLSKCVELRIYNPRKYDINPVEYCGMYINSSII